MLNQKSIAAVDASTFSSDFRKPLYDSYCFSNIPGTIEALLSGKSDRPQLPDDTLAGKEYDKVILFFVDAFGWRFFERYKDKYPVLKRFVENGVASKITSQFPSTTAAHVTTIHTGQRVDESGIYEWYYYEPKLDAMIAPLLFSYAGDQERGTLQGVVEPSDIYPTDSLYQHLKNKGITTYQFQSRAITPSPYGDAVTSGITHVHPFTTLDTALADLSDAVVNESGKAYFFFYYGNIDSTGHTYGPNSPEFAAEVDLFFTKLEELFVDTISGKCGKTLLLMTADHGQTDIDPATTVYLNQELPEITEWIKTNQAGDLLVPGGSARDLFLYIKDEFITTAITQLTDMLKGKAEVYAVEELLQQGFFGDAPSDNLKSRIGNVCILPYKNDSVFWWEKGRFEQNFYGHHGGLTPDEMDSIFLAMEL